MTFLEKPHVPERKIGLCAIAAGHNEIKRSLELMGITVLEVLSNSSLDLPVSRHADMQLHDMGGGEVTVAAGAYELIAALEYYGFKVHTHALSSKYPGDIALNCFCLKKILFCREAYVSHILLNYYQSKKICISDVKQGYAKCSACIVNDTSLITSDKSIANAAKSHGIDVLVISAGGIRLDGHDYGFIGGSCGLVDKDKLAFCGTISKHPDYSAIESFCHARGVELIELCDSPLLDVGGIIPLAF